MRGKIKDDLVGNSRLRVTCNQLNKGWPQGFRQVMAHTINQFQPCTGYVASGIHTALNRNQGVILAVDHQRWRNDAPKLTDAASAGGYCCQLTRSTARTIITPVAS